VRRGRMLQRRLSARPEERKDWLAVQASTHGDACACLRWKEIARGASRELRVSNKDESLRPCWYGAAIDSRGVVGSHEGVS
jgi:hypothetical protein